MSDNFADITATRSEKLKKFFTYIVLVLVVSGFFVWGIFDFLVNNKSSKIAKVGNVVITSKQFEQEFSFRVKEFIAKYGQKQVKDVIKTDLFKNLVFSDMVNRLLFEQELDDIGVSVTKDLVVKLIKDEERFKTDGQYDHKSFESFLAANYLTESEYINTKLYDIQRRIIVDPVIYKTSNYNDVAKLYFAALKQQRKVDVLTFTPSDMAMYKLYPENITDEKINDFYKENISLFTKPEVRDVGVIDVVSSIKQLNSVTVSQKEVDDIYNRKFKQDMQEKRTFYAFNFDKKDLAESAFAEFNNSSNIDGLSQKYFKKSKDDFEFLQYSRSDLKEMALDEVVFSLKIGESKLVKTSMGFYIVFLKSVFAPSNSDYLKLKQEIKDQLLERKICSLASAKFKKLEDDSLTISSIEELSEKNKLPLSIVSITADDNKVLPSDVKSRIFAVQGSSSYPVPFKDDDSCSYYVFSVRSVRSSKAEPLSEVKGQIAAIIKSRNNALLASKFSIQIGNDYLRLPSDDFYKKYPSIKIKTITLGRDFDGYDKGFVSDIFDVGTDVPTKVFGIGDGKFAFAIVKTIENKSIDKIDGSLKEVDELGQSIKKEIVSENFYDFISYLMRKHGVKVYRDEFKYVN